MRHEVLQGHVLDRLRELPDNSVDCVVTSPPFYGLRNYGTDPQVWGGDAGCEHEWVGERAGAKTPKRQIPHMDGRAPESDCYAKERIDVPTTAVSLGGASCQKCGAWRGELGSEPTLDLFIEHLTLIFREVRRVLEKTGTCWVEFGDSRAGSWGAQGWPTNLTVPNAGVYQDRSPSRNPKRQGLKKKELMLVPFRLALSLQMDGWYVRDLIIWQRPNPMPESVKDRTTCAHSYVFMLTKSEKYFYDADAIAEPCSENTHARTGKIKVPDGWDTAPGSHGTVHREGRSKGQYVDVPDNYKGSVPGRKDGPGQDRRSEKPRSRDNFARLTKEADVPGQSAKQHRLDREPTFAGLTRNSRSVWSIPTQGRSEPHFASFPDELPRRCLSAGCPKDGLALDIFCGRGTTLVVAKRLGISAIGIELNEDYVKLARKNVADAQSPLFSEAA